MSLFVAVVECEAKHLTSSLKTEYTFIRSFLSGGETLSRMKVRHDPSAHKGNAENTEGERCRTVLKYPIATDRAMKRIRVNDTSLWGWRRTRQR